MQPRLPSTTSDTARPIFNEATWDALQARYADPARRTNRERTDVRHLLSGIARCGACGGRMTRVRDPRGKGAYRCRETGEVVRQQQPLDALVTEEVLARLAEPDAAEQLLAAADDPAVNEATARAQALQGQLDEAYVEFRARRMSAGLLARIEADVQPEIDAALREAGRSAPLPGPVLELAGPQARAKWAKWDAAGEVTKQRKVVQAVVEVMVLPGQRPGRAPFDPELVRIEWRH